MKDPAVEPVTRLSGFDDDARPSSSWVSAWLIMFSKTAMRLERTVPRLSVQVRSGRFGPPPLPSCGERFREPRVCGVIGTGTDMR